MNALNLDKFSNKREFTHNDVTFTIRGMKVKELRPFTEAMSKAKTDEDKVEAMVAMLSNLTTMSKEQLEDLEIGELSALISISQGTDPSVDNEGK